MVRVRMSSCALRQGAPHSTLRSEFKKAPSLMRKGMLTHVARAPLRLQLADPSLSNHTHTSSYSTTTMKFAAICVALLGSTAQAFAPSKNAQSSSLKMSDSSSEVPLLQVKEKVPCFGAAPFLGDNPVFFGENYWDKLTLEYGSEDTGKYLRAAELKHGRSAMLAGKKKLLAAAVRRWSVGRHIKHDSKGRPFSHHSTLALRQLLALPSKSSESLSTRSLRTSTFLLPRESSLPILLL